MLYISVEDFLTQAKTAPCISWDEKKSLAQQMAAGDQAARQTLIRSHLPLVAAFVARAPQSIRTLHTVYACIAAVEKSLTKLPAQQDNKTFTHDLNWQLRQCITKCIADQSR